jgi:F-type H+-transporting ATPase subunit delta
VLENPDLPTEVKTVILIRAAGDLSREMQRLATLLCERVKACLLPEIVEMFDQMQREAEAEVVAEVVVACKLPDDIKGKLSASIEKVAGRKVKLKVSEDASIIGGAVIRIGDRQIDHSVLGRIEGLKRAIAA